MWDIAREWQILLQDANAYNSWATRVAWVKTSVRCVLWCAVRAQMCRASGRSAYTSRRLSGSLSPGQPKLVLSEKKVFTNGQTVENARNSNFLSSNCCVPNSWTRTMATKATGFPALVYRTSSLFEGRPHSRTLRFLRTVVLFFVSLAGFDEWFFFPAGSLPSIRRVISCIPFSLEQSRVVYSTVWFSLKIHCSELRILSLLVATYQWFSKSILSSSMMPCSVYPMRVNESLYL